MRGEMTTISMQVKAGEKSWSWAANAETQSSIDNATNGLNSCCSEFAYNFMVSKAKTIRTIMTDTQPMDNLRDMIHLMTEPVARCEKLICKLKGMRDQFVMA